MRILARHVICKPFVVLSISPVIYGMNITHDGPRASPLGDHMTRKDVKGDQPSGGETTWTNTGATRYGRGQHKTGSFGDDMLRPSPNHGTQRLPNDDDDYNLQFTKIRFGNICT